LAIYTWKTFSKEANSILYDNKGGIPYGMYLPFALSIHHPNMGTIIKKPYKNIWTAFDISFWVLLVILGFIDFIFAKGFIIRIDIVKNKIAKPM
jgi:hypothetical protein